MDSSEKARWCLVGNVGGLRSAEAIAGLRGNKHFSRGTKVYCLPAQWGDGYRKIYVIGRHRGAGTYSRLVIPSELISNWRIQMIYSPAVLRSIDELLAEPGGASWQSREQVEEALLMLAARGASIRAA